MTFEGAYNWLGNDVNSGAPGKTRTCDLLIRSQKRPLNTGAQYCTTSLPQIPFPVDILGE